MMTIANTAPEIGGVGDRYLRGGADLVVIGIKKSLHSNISIAELRCNDGIDLRLKI
jgi:hypothetical protein